ncbi:MAG: type II secretion system protein N [Sphingomonas sp.]
MLGIASYLFALIAIMPASVVFTDRPWRSGVAGSVWHGEVGVVGGTTVRWDWAPLRSLTSLAFAADWRATGQDTDLRGGALVGPSSIQLDHVSGSANASLLQAIEPNLPFTCAMTGQVEFERIVAGGSSRMVKGEATSDPGSCRPKGAAAATALPALILVAEHIGRESRIRLAPMTQRRKTLIVATLKEDGTLDLTVSPEGAAMMPFLGAVPGARIQGRM